MPRVLLIRTETVLDEGIRAEDSTFEHLGLGYLASYLDSHGCAVDLADLVLGPMTPKDVRDRVAAGLYGLVGITIPWQQAIGSGLELARELKQARPDVHVCLGGHFPTAAHDLLLRDFPQIDSVVRGEGEIPLLALTSRIMSGRPLSGISGLTFRQAGAVVAEPLAAPVADLDVLPFPRRDLIPPRSGNLQYAEIVSSRGCQFHCSYCSISNFYGQGLWRGRGIANIVAEMAEIYHRLGCKGFYFSDDNFVPPGPAGRERVEEFCRALEARGLTDLTLVAMLAPTCITAPIISRLYGAGLRSVLVGMESASPAQLRRLHKATTPAVNARALEVLSSHDLKISVGLIMFDPDCSLADIRMNIDFLRPHAHYLIFEPLNRLDVYTGTPVYHDLARRGRLTGTYLDPQYEFADPKVAWLYEVSTRLLQRWMGRISDQALNLGEAHDRRTLVHRRFRRQQMLGFVLDVLTRLTDFAEQTSSLPAAAEAVARLAPTVEAGFTHLRDTMETAQV